MSEALSDRDRLFRFGFLGLVACALAACQSTSSNETTSAIPALESAAGVEETSETDIAAVPGAENNETAETVDVAAASPPAAQSESDRLRNAVIQIAGLEKEQGRDAAFRSVLACYERAKSREAPVVVAKECATQDFVISRGRQEAGGQRDQQLIIAERAPQRIGAMMELKGMGQTEFNSFGLFLNRVALPAYRQARS